MYINNYEKQFNLSNYCPPMLINHDNQDFIWLFKVKNLARINEALELALAAIDQESKRTESLIIEEVSATVSTTATTTTMLPSATINTSSNAEILINKTDEEKVENLQYLQANEIFCQQQQQHEEKGEGLLKSESSVEEEKTEEEISKEPIYENVNPVTSLSRASQNIPSMISKSLISNSNDQISIIMNNNNNNSIINNNNEPYDSQTNKINQNYNSTIVGLTNNAFANPMAKIEMGAIAATAAATITANALITIAATVNVTGTTTIATTTTASPNTVTTTNSTNNLQLITQAKETTFNEISENPKQNCTALKTFNGPTMNPMITINTHTETAIDLEPYYQVPKSCEPYYDAPKHLKPVPVYENIEMFFNASANNELSSLENSATLEPPKEKPPPPPCESPPAIDELDAQTDAYSSDNTYETLTHHQHHYHHHHHHSNHLLQSPSGLIDHQHLPHSPPIKRMNSTKRIKKELRNKRSSFLGLEGSNLDDDETYLELTVAPPPDMAQLLQEERRLEKQLYLKAGLCDSSDTGESRDSGVSENHSRQSSEHYTNSSEENDSHDVSTSPLTLETQSPSDPPASELIYQNDGLLQVAPTPLLQTVKGNSAESWTESATVAAAATKSLTEATATANAKMMSIEEKIREQEEVLRVERELLQLEQEELKRQRENLMLRENIARRELQHGAKMLMSANRRSLQDLNGVKEHNVPINADNVNVDSLKGSSLENAYLEPRSHAVVLSHHYSGKMLPPQPQHSQQIYANVSNLQQQYYHMDTDYRKSMSDINEFSKCMIAPPMPPSKPMRAMHVNAGSDQSEFGTRQTHSLNTQQFGGSLVKIAQPVTPCRGPIYSNYLHQSAQNLNTSNALASAKKTSVTSTTSMNNSQPMYPGHMSRNTLHALSATPKPKYTDGWVQVQNRKSFDSNLANDSAWLSAYQQKRKSMPDAYGSGNNQWLLSEQHQAQYKRSTISSNNTPLHQSMNGTTKLTNGLTATTATSTVSSSSAINNSKPLPDSIIQTLTERVQSKGLGERKRNHLDKSPLPGISTFHQHPYPSSSKMTPTHLNAANPQQASAKLTGTTQRSTSHRVITNGQNATATSSSSSSIATTQDKVLSVSGKKKCSHCGEELGRGAAMIIESLLLFYHINCFKCCVCHVQLGDGLNGTDVRVRNHKLHCQNCYSSDDGIKFSCV
uniref:LIM zinc-binding domain-containing protein n=1 Tax=Glossina morsitans morsitans TaxID=37546 RepID=A0A1B0FD95_GLOMM